ncbi:MAG: DoxX family protein [Ferruginibacter sp.]
MKKLFTTNYSAGAFNTAMLLLRLVFGILLMNHGYSKLTHFNETAQHMPSIFGMGGTVTAALVVFAEFFCSLFIILGLFTRMACIPLLICMGYALFKSHKGEVFGDGEMAALYMGAFLTLLIIGPGKVSVDGMIGK